MVLPVVIILFSLIGFPLVYAIFLSFCAKSPGTPFHFIGVRNYLELLRDSTFRLTVFNVGIYTSISVFLKFGLGIVLALILNQIREGRKVLRGALLLPWVVPTTLSALVWWWMYDPMFGVINWTLIKMGIVHGRTPWLSNPFWARVAVIITNTWRGLPFFAITFLAGLVAIPNDLMDSAKIDGAGSFGRFWYITFPLLAPLLSIVTLFSVIMTSGDFALVHIITSGGPRNTTHLFATLAFQVGIKGGTLGEAAAISLFILPLLAASAYLILKFIRKQVA